MGSTTSSSGHGAHLFDQLRSLGILDVFERIVVTPWIRGEVDKALPFSREVKIPRKSIRAWIGDTEADLAAARKLGVPSILVTCGLRSRRFLAPLEPDFLVDRLSATARLHVLAK